MEQGIDDDSFAASNIDVYFYGHGVDLLPARVARCVDGEPRRRRNIIVMLTLFIVLLGQVPNLYFNVFFRHGRGGMQRTAARHSGQQGFTESIPPGWIAAHDYVPVLWVPDGALALAQGNALPAVLGSLGALLLGAAGLARAYRATMKFYLGQEKVKAVPVRAEIAGGGGRSGPCRKNFIEKRVPYVSEEVAALALAFFRSMTRAPEIRIALFTNAVVVIVVFGALFSNVLKGKTGMFQLFSVTGAVGFTFFGLVQLMFNQFGYDREGFRSLVLSPTARKDVLLAKNLALAPFVFVLGLLLLAALAGVTHVPVLGVLAGAFRLIMMYMLLSMAGNFVSSRIPYRISGGSLKPTKPPIKIVFVMMLCQFLFPLMMLPVIVPPLLGMLLEKLDFWPAPWTDAILSFMLAAVAFFYGNEPRRPGQLFRKSASKGFCSSFFHRNWSERDIAKLAKCAIAQKVLMMNWQNGAI